MNLETVRLYALDKPGTEESFPFDDTTLVVKVGGKIFILLSLDQPSMNLKADPEMAIEWRERYPAVVPGYHMNKKHWNTVALDGSLSDEVLREMIDHSYSLVFNALPLKVRTEIANQ